MTLLVRTNTTWQNSNRSICIFKVKEKQKYKAEKANNRQAKTFWKIGYCRGLCNFFVSYTGSCKTNVQESGCYGTNYSLEIIQSNKETKIMHSKTAGIFNTGISLGFVNNGCVFMLIFLATSNRSLSANSVYISTCNRIENAVWDWC